MQFSGLAGSHLAFLPLDRMPGITKNRIEIYLADALRGFIVKGRAWRRSSPVADRKWEGQDAFQGLPQ